MLVRTTDKFGPTVIDKFVEDFRDELTKRIIKLEVDRERYA